MNDFLASQGIDLASRQYGSSQINHLNALKSQARQSGSDNEAAQKVAQDFEAVFIGQMLQPIFETIPEDSLFGGGPGEKIFKTMMVDEIGKEIAKAGGVGIAKHVMDEIIKLQEG